jgi:hypothetical protein
MVSSCQLKGYGAIVDRKALIDCGADGVFMNKTFAEKNRITQIMLENPIKVRNVDGSPNIGGDITHMTKMEITIQGRKHMQHFLITNIAENDIILGITWLREQNPLINWKEGTLNWEWWIREEPEHVDMLEWIKGIETSETKTVDLRKKVPKEYHEYLNVFSEEAASRMPTRKVWDHKIELKEDFEPRSSGIYKLTPAEDEATREFIKENLEKGYIRPSKSPMASPFFFVPKKDGKKRPCQDYRFLNQGTRKNAYPLPLIDEIMDRLKGRKLFTKFDVRWGYNNVRIAKGDEWKAAFKTKYGLFEPTVMFFGLCNSPATFQNMMDHIFKEEIEKGIVIVYMDDILILADTEEELAKTTKIVLRKLKENDLYLKPEKCEFAKEKVEYLGMVVKGNEIAMDTKKVKAIMEWPAPKTVKEVRSFLGLGNFYRKFIRKYSDVVKPLNELLQKDRVFQWTEEAQKVFQDLKERFCEEPVLKTPDTSKPFQIECDTSKFAIGAVLTQLDSNGSRHPVAFLSKTFTTTERRYKIHDRELMAVITSLKEWRHYIQGSPFTTTILSDHKNLTYFRKAQKLNDRQGRWSLILSEYDIELVHTPGDKMIQSDALSRRADLNPRLDDDNNEPTVLLTKDLFVRLIDTKLQTRILTSKGTELDIQKALETLKNSEIDQDLNEWTTEETENGKAIFYQGRQYIPDNIELRREIVQKFHDSVTAGHPGELETFNQIKECYWWPGLRTFVKNYVKGCPDCQQFKINRRPTKPTLQAIPGPDTIEPFKQISMDFITDLPSIDGYDTILSMVDHGLTKGVILIPTDKTVTAEKTAQLILDHVHKRFGLPDKIISDRGPQFAAKFFKEIC